MVFAPGSPEIVLAEVHLGFLMAPIILFPTLVTLNALIHPIP